MVPQSARQTLPRVAIKTEDGDAAKRLAAILTRYGFTPVEGEEAADCIVGTRDAGDGAFAQPGDAGDKAQVWIDPLALDRHGAAHLAERLRGLLRLRTMEREWHRRSALLARFGLGDADMPAGLPQPEGTPRYLIAGEAGADYGRVDHTLRRAGAEVVAAFTPETSADYLSQGGFDGLVLLLEGDAGGYLPMIAAMRRNPSLFNTPVLVVGDAERLDAPEELYRQGVSDVVIRPLSEADVLTRLSAYREENAARGALRQAFRRFRPAATQESVSGLFTRAFFMEHLAATLSAGDVPFSLGVLRVANLADLRASSGYAGADHVLRQCAGLIDGLARGEDLVARLSDDRFGVIFPDTDLTRARTPLKRMERIIATTEFHTAEAERPAHVEIAVTAAECLEAADHSAESLLATAQDARLA